MLVDVRAQARLTTGPVIRWLPGGYADDRLIQDQRVVTASTEPKCLSIMSLWIEEGRPA